LAVQSPTRSTVGPSPPLFTLNSAGFSTVFAGSDVGATDFRVASPGEM
jgi:hypothetical protein